MNLGCLHDNVKLLAFVFVRATLQTLSEGQPLEVQLREFLDLARVDHEPQGIHVEEDEAELVLCFLLGDASAACPHQHRTVALSAAVVGSIFFLHVGAGRRQLAKGPFIERATCVANVEGLTGRASVRHCEYSDTAEM
jgi:hypothetical protein